MRSRLAGAPWWVLALIYGMFFGIGMACLGLRDPEVFGGGAPGLVIRALFTGVPFGMVMGLFTADRNRHLMAAAGVADQNEMAAIIQASSRGPLPDDPTLRAAALNLARYRCSEFQRRRRSNLTFFGLGALGYIALAIFSSPWWTLAAVVFLALLITVLILPARLQRRIDALGEPLPTAPEGPHPS